VKLRAFEGEPVRGKMTSEEYQEGQENEKIEPDED